MTKPVAVSIPGVHIVVRKCHFPLKVRAVWKMTDYWSEEKVYRRSLEHLDIKDSTQAITERLCVD